MVSRLVEKVERFQHTKELNDRKLVSIAFKWLLISFHSTNANTTLKRLSVIKVEKENAENDIKHFLLACRKMMFTLFRSSPNIIQEGVKCLLSKCNIGGEMSRYIVLVPLYQIIH